MTGFLVVLREELPNLSSVAMSAWRWMKDNPVVSKPEFVLTKTMLQVQRRLSDEDQQTRDCRLPIRQDRLRSRCQVRHSSHYGQRHHAASRRRCVVSRSGRIVAPQPSDLPTEVQQRSSELVQIRVWPGHYHFHRVDIRVGFAISAWMSTPEIDKFKWLPRATDYQ